MSHRAMSITTLNKLIPGLLPPKDEPDSPVDFLSILDGFDPSVLTQDQLKQIAVSEPALTGYPIDKTYEYEGEVRPVPPQPISWRIEHGERLFQSQRESLEKAQNRGTSYKSCRDRLAKAIKTKTALYIATVQEKHMTASQKEEESNAWNRYYYQAQGMRIPGAPPTPEEIAAREEGLKQARIKSEQLHEIYEYLARHDDARETVYRMIRDPDRSFRAVVSRNAPPK